MFPCFVVLNTANLHVVDAVSRCQIFLCCLFGREKPSNRTDGFIVQLRLLDGNAASVILRHPRLPRPLLNRKSFPRWTTKAIPNPVPYIFKGRNVFQVAQSWVQFVQVAVVYLKAHRAGSQERSSYQTMYRKIPFFVVSPKPNHEVASVVNASRQYVGGPTKITCSTQIAYLIRRLPSGNGLPRFVGKFFGCIFDNSHDLNLTDRLGLWSGSGGALNVVRAVSILA